MPSIKRIDAAHLIGKFHSDYLLPLGDEYARSGNSLFPPGPEPGLISYYIQRPKRQTQNLDFEVPGTENAADFEEALARLWKEQGHPELVPLASKLAEIAESLRLSEEPDHDVSPFLYVMF